MRGNHLAYAATQGIIGVVSSVTDRKARTAVYFAVRVCAGTGSIKVNRPLLVAMYVAGEGTTVLSTTCCSVLIITII